MLRGKIININSIHLRIIEEVHLRRREQTKNKEKQSSKIKNDLLNKKRLKQEKENYLTAQKIVKNYRENQKAYSYSKKQTFMNKSRVNKFYDQTREGSPILVIRILGVWDRISDNLREILTKLKLKKLFSATLIKYNKDNFKILNLIDSFITWGFTNKKLISELVMKRGTSYHGSDNTLRELDNTEIESNLGKDNILCMEDLIFELSSNKSKNFDKAMGFLGFFLLSPCELLKENAVLPYYKGGCSGFRGDEINKLAKQMI